MAFWLSAAVLSGVGAAAALQGASNGATEPVLEAVSELVGDPRAEVRVAGGSERLRVAALRLAAAWERTGVATLVVPEEKAGASPVVVTTGAFPETLQPFGLEAVGSDVQGPDGRRWPRASIAACLTLTASLGEDGRPLSARFGLASTGSTGATTFLLGESADAPPVIGALSALGAAPPPVASRLTIWSSGQQIFRAPIDPRGYVDLAAGTAYPVLTSVSEAPKNGAVQRARAHQESEILRKAVGLAGAVANLGEIEPPASPVTVRFVDSIESRARDGAVQRLGWYDGAANQLVVLVANAPKEPQDELQLERIVEASVDDALFAYAEAQLLRALGPPASPWFARGTACILTGRCGGFSLTEIESRTGDVTPAEVLRAVHPRTRLTAAPAETRLARSLLVELENDVSAAWSLRVEDDPELIKRLEASWTKSFERSPIEPRLAVPRSLNQGAIVEVETSAELFGTAALDADLERIAGLGFAGVQFDIHVPVPAPLSPAERRELALELSGWGHAVTLEGDGAVVVTALKARALGLSVVLAPHFVTSASGSLGRKQIHGSAERIQTYGDRRALAMEGVAWLAEQASADALILFDPEDLPRADPNAWPPHPPELVAAYDSTRRQSLVYSRPFAGDRLAFIRSRGGLKRALEADMTAGFGGPLAVVRLKLGLEFAMDDGEAEVARAQRVLACVGDAEDQLWALRVHRLTEANAAGPWKTMGALDAASGTDAPLGPRFFFAGRFGLAGAEDEGVNLRDLDDGTLRSIAARRPHK